MRVCMLTRYFDFRNAGLGRVALELRKGVLEQGHQVKSISTNGNGLGSYFVYSSLEIPFRLPRGWDIYHALTPVESIWLPKDKSLVTFHDIILVTDPSKAGTNVGSNSIVTKIGRWYFTLAAKAATRSRYVVCVSEATRMDVVKYVGVDESKTLVIRSGINEALHPLPIGHSSTFRIGYLGQLDKRKRITHLVEEFRKSSLDAELVIGGIGPEDSLIKKIADGDPRIKIMGLIPEEDLNLFYNSMELFIFPSAMEGYGLPIVEAMACKVPVMVLEDSKIPWEVKGKCLIQRDLKTTFSNMKYLQTLTRSLDVERNFSFAKEHKWETTVEKYLEVYDAIRRPK